ncbi:hypothetical protein EXIGLDRAFT_730638 [Exidia glandulosa HHB12029]|uniref:Uncharacterized protein n=1 Tax=Exidia glandulosa HHB12029 TaxID=1314781 RepID=A0A165GPY8_EXIGL|nr:hypothetical protein EXIGLDRAFT_719872 [Exidia glandulosa HHB12029]KZV97422.1 hypothetical protein EXIGLDRAFT_730638 [Exidia glandulosa HHB12029]
MAPSTEPYHMRVTTYNHVRNFVSFALKFLEENPDRPLVLHTLPAADVTNDTTTASHGKRKRTDTDEAQPAPKRAKPSQSTDSVPRLLSVVEIIQREYLESRKIGQSGLHQYNEIGTLEDEGLAPATEHVDPLDAALRGKNFTKIRVTPFMRITLCTRPVPELVDKGSTYQGEPPVRKKSKAAKSRERAQRRQEKSSLED